MTETDWKIAAIVHVIIYTVISYTAGYQECGVAISDLSEAASHVSKDVKNKKRHFDYIYDAETCLKCFVHMCSMCELNQE